MIEEKWASPADFATLFQYLWHRDFPMDQKSTGARRSDWTIHTGIVVRNIADMIGLVARFEHGGRTDAILRSTEGDEIAVEWEWGGVWGNELDKLIKYEPWKTGKLKYAALITYTHTENIEKVYDNVQKRWDGAKWPLLLILIDLKKVETRKYTIGKEFNNIQMSVFHNGGHSAFRKTPAFPWEVAGTRWSYQYQNLQSPKKA